MLFSRKIQKENTYRTKSITTRIETDFWIKPEKIDQFLIVQSPLQQGLKHIFLKIKYMPIRLIVQSPLQQGLKHSPFSNA